MLGFFAVAATPDLQGQLTFKPFPKGLLIGIGFPPPLSQMTINASSSQTVHCASPRARTIRSNDFYYAAKVEHNIAITQEIKMSEYQ